METAEARLGRLRLRSMRRGIREMDLILTDFAGRHLATMTEDEIRAYDALLAENDHDLYGWILGLEPAPAAHGALIGRIAASARALGERGRDGTG
ncbi:MAG: succinate dehydrogenase assembly factor 2 [Rubellimicrobium sp.]|nr:succinate dehydrogenase assembly factor 2 [Rubellimicrobium sp.]